MHCQQRPDAGRAEEVRRAGDDEEGHAAARDVLGRNSVPLQRPRAEREPAGATGRKQDVRRLLGHPDLVAESPRHSRAEHAAESQDVGEARRDLEHARSHDPERVGVLEPASQVAKSRQRADERGHDHAEERQLHQTPRDVAWMELVRHGAR